MALHQKQRLQNLLLIKTRHDSTHFPSLFSLAVKACVHNIQIFATLEGLPFTPFGQALSTYFFQASDQGRLTTEQRQLGILLFAEAYGYHPQITGSNNINNEESTLGPEFTGLQSCLATDVPFLDLFSHCLVYLDLSPPSASCRQDRLTSSESVNDEYCPLSDSDIASLSCLTHLSILDLSGLAIGDIGLSHLVRSVSFGTGPVGLEYLNLAGTNVTAKGLVMMFKKESKRSTTTTIDTQEPRYHPALLVFTQLLGLDVTASQVDEHSASLMFPAMLRPTGTVDAATTFQLGWKRLKNNMQIFPNSQSKETCLYIERDTQMNPVKPWVERFHQQPHRLPFGKKPNLEENKDGFGLAECLALAKMGQLYLHPAPELPTTHMMTTPQDWQQRPRHKRKSKRYRNRMYEQNEGNDKALGRDNVEVMFNLHMYQRILDMVRVHSMAAKDSQKRIASLSKGSPRLAFVRDRSDIDKHLQHGSGLILNDTMPSTTTTRQHNALGAGNNESANLPLDTTAKLKTQKKTLTAKDKKRPQTILQSLMSSANTTLEDQQPRLYAPSRHSRTESIKPTLVGIKREYFTTEPAMPASQPEPFGRLSATPSTKPDGIIPTRRKRPRSGQELDILTRPHQPFLKPKDEISKSLIFYNDTVPVQNPSFSDPFAASFTTKTMETTETKASISSKKKSSGNLLTSWIQTTAPSSTRSTPSSTKASQDQKRATPSIIREFHWHEPKKDAVSLHRWIKGASHSNAAG
ncbi:hypothetical protein BGZ94_004425 [Podila epigama]|nr:hypothetical protein BGZ94_004425 [Podila epigama]